jgi:hypothetical protein
MLGETSNEYYFIGSNFSYFAEDEKQLLRYGFISGVPITIIAL